MLLGITLLIIYIFLHFISFSYHEMKHLRPREIQIMISRTFHSLLNIKSYRLSDLYNFDRPIHEELD